MPITTQRLTREEALRRATLLRPALRERAADAELARRMPDATVKDLIRSGLLRIGNPDLFGGNGLEYNVALEVASEMGRACPSSAWCYAIWASHNWVLGQLPLEAQEEYFADPDVLSSSSATLGTAATPVEGGYRCSGHWEFSSGCDAAAFAFLSLPSPDGQLRILIPRSDFNIVDTWFVSGLRATGSKDIVIDDVFVPAHRTILTALIGGPGSNGWQLHHRPSYRLPLMSIYPFTVVCALPGIVQGALDEFINRIAHSSLRSPETASTAIHLRISEASAEIDCANLLMRTETQWMIDKAAREEDLTDLEMARAQRTRGFMSKLCLQAVDRLFEVSGGHALFESEAIQRHHRDAHALSHRTGLLLDLAGQGYGRTALGFEI